MTNIVVVTALVLLCVGVWYAWSRLRSLKRKIADVENNAAVDRRLLAERLANTAQQNLEIQNSRHLQALVDQERKFNSQRAQLNKELCEARKETEKLLKRHCRSVDVGDWKSANDIRSVATDAGLSLVLLTNLVLPNRSVAGEVFWSQIDHLVITKNRLLIIENKRWSGLVVDSIDPRSVLGRVNDLLADAELGSCNNTALHITCAHDGKNQSDLVLRIRRHGDGSARRMPANQARQQALAMKKFLADHGECNIQWIHTAVYYSYPGARVYKNPYNGKTRVVSTMNELESLLREASEESSVTAPRDVIDVRCITSALSNYGANVVGTGGYSDLTSCPVALQENSSHEYLR